MMRMTRIGEHLRQQNPQQQLILNKKTADTVNCEVTHTAAEKSSNTSREAAAGVLPTNA